MFCVVAGMISWALIMREQPSGAIVQPYALSCFADETHCAVTSAMVNNALRVADARMRSECIAQAAGK